MKRIKTKKQLKTSKKAKKTYKNKRNSKTRRRLRGGGEKEKKKQIVKDNFRNMFMNSFKKLQAAIKAGNMERVKEVTEILKMDLKVIKLV